MTGVSEFVDVTTEDGEADSVNNTTEPTTDSQDKFDGFIAIEVSNARHIGDGLSAFVVYDVVTKTDVAAYTSCQKGKPVCSGEETQKFFSVHRFSDFMAIHDTLVAKYSPNGILVPPVPEKDALSATRLRLGSKILGDNGLTQDTVVESQSCGDISTLRAWSDADLANESIDDGHRSCKFSVWKKTDQFIERRRVLLQRFLTRVVSHRILRQDSDVKDFLTRECVADDVLFRNRTTTGPSAVGHAGKSDSVLKKFGQMAVAKASALASSLGSSTQTLEETDSWFYNRTNHYERLESLLRIALATAETLSQKRSVLATETHQLSSALDSLANLYTTGSSPEDVTLAANIGHLATTYGTIASKVYTNQSRLDWLILSTGCLKDYLAMVVAVRDGFQTRSQLWQDWQSLFAALSRRRANRDKVQAMLDQCAGLENQPMDQNQIKLKDKVDQLTSEVIDLERAEIAAQNKFEQLSSTLKEEIVEFERSQRRLLWSKTVTSYLATAARVQLDLAADWDRYLANVTPDDNMVVTDLSA